MTTVTLAPSLNLLSLPFLGSLYHPQVSNRETLPLESNETASFVPSLFIDPLKRGPCTESVQVLFYRILPSLVLQSDINFITQLKADIQDHMENRLQLFCQQVFMVYRTNLDFSYSMTTRHQAGLKMEAASQIALQEAHCSTLPCLLFTHQQKTYIFGSGSSYYHAQNMTVKLPIETNQVDSWIDKSKKEFKGFSLRDEAKVLIQLASAAQINPVQAFQYFIDYLLLRLNKFETTHQEPKEKLSCQFYTQAVASYKTQLVKDATLMRALCFEHRSTTAVDEIFFLKVQQRLHSCLELDLRVAAQREKLLMARPLSNTQNMYAKIYLNAPDLISGLRNYFISTPIDQLQIDWSRVVHVTAKRRNGISEGLDRLISEILAQIELVYEVQAIQKVGAIMASILYQASITLRPEVHALYSLPEIMQSPVTRSVAKQIEALSPMPVFVAQPVSAAPSLSKQQTVYLNQFLSAAHIRALLESYYRTNQAAVIQADLSHVESITPTKMSKLSPSLQSILQECLQIAGKNPQKMGHITRHLLERTALR